MARDFRTKQIRTSVVVASGSITGSRPHLGLVFLSGSKMKDHNGTFLTGAGDPSTLNSTHLFDVNGAAVAEPGLFLSHGTIGTDVWCLFDGASRGNAGVSSNRLKGSSVLFLGDVVISGSLFAERHVVEVDSTTAGHFFAPKNSYLGDQGSGVYALRINPDNGTVDGIGANCVQVAAGTDFKTMGDTFLGGGNGAGGVTVGGNTGWIWADDYIRTDTELRTARIAYTDGDDAIAISDGGYLKLNSGIKYPHGVRVSSDDSGALPGGAQWLKIASTTGTHKDQTTTVFLITCTYPGWSDTATRWADQSFIVRARYSANSGSPYHYPHLTDISVEPVHGKTLRNFNPETYVGFKIDSNMKCDIYFKTDIQYTNVYVTQLGGNHAVNDTHEIPGFSILTGQSWVTDPTLTVGGQWASKRFDNVIASQITGSAGLAVEMNSQKINFFHDGTQNVLSSSVNLKIVSNDGAGDVVIDGNFGLAQVSVEQYIRHTGDADTFLEFPADDQIKLSAGGVEFIHAIENESQDKLVINPGNADVDFVVESGNSNWDMIYGDAATGVRKLNLGSFTNGSGIQMQVDVATGVIVNPDSKNGGYVDFTVKGAGTQSLLQADTSADSVLIIGDADNDTIFKITDGSKTLVDVTDNTTNGIALGHATIPVKIVGDLEVGGSTTTVNTTNLLVEDPIIVLNKANGSANGQGGIAIENGGSSTDMVFGRVANDTWGVGTKDTSAGAVVTLADMTLGAFRASKVEFGGTDESITGDGTDITFAVGAGGDINVPANIGITFGDDGEKIEGDGTDLRFFGNNLILSASADVLIPGGVGLAWGPNSLEKIESDGTNITISASKAGGDIILDPAGQVVIDGDAQLSFGAVSSGENIERVGASGGIRMQNDAGHLYLNSRSGLGAVVIEGNATTNRIVFGDHDHNQTISSSGNATDTDLTLSAGLDIVLNATQQVRVPANIELEFGAAGSGEHIVGDGNDLSLISGRDIILNPTGDIVVDGSSKLEFNVAGSGEHISGNGTDLTIVSGGDIALSPANDVNIPQDIGLTFGADTQKIESDGSNNLSLAAAGELKSLTDLNIATSKHLRFTDTNVRVYRDGLNMMFRDQRQTTAVDLTTLNTRDVSTTTIRHALGPDRIKASGSFSIDKQDRFANDLGSDIWFYVDSNDGTRNKSVFAKDLILSSSLKFIDTSDAASFSTVAHTSDSMIFSIDSTEMMRIDPTIGVKLGDGKGVYFNSTTMNLTKATNDFKFSTGNSAATGLIIGDNNDGHDRTVIFGHSTLKTIMGIDDSADAFVINTDSSFDNTLKNNSLTIDANHDITMARDLTVARNLIVSGSLDLAEGLGINFGDINCDSISVDDVSVGLDIQFGGNTSLNKITLADNLADALNITEAGNSYLKFITSNSSEKIEIYKDFIPNGSVDLGSNANRFANIYTNDLNLCNEGRGNDVDGTSGNWTIQEGEDHLYVINNITGKKFKMMLQPVEDGE